MPSVGGESVEKQEQAAQGATGENELKRRASMKRRLMQRTLMKFRQRKMVIVKMKSWLRRREKFRNCNSRIQSWSAS